MKKLLALFAAAAIAGCGEQASEPASSPAESHYYPSETTIAGKAHPWLVILPGGGGIEVFGDKQFYFDVAKRWNEAGFDALVVHYQEAAPLIPGAEQPTPATMEAAVVADALAAAGRNEWLDLDCPGFVIGFSMGGAGVMTLAADPPANLAGAIGYYPLVAGQPEGFKPKVPVLILQGEKDELTTRDALDKFLSTADANQIEVHLYPEAEHGFDIPSLATPVEFNNGTFRYHEESAIAANREEGRFRQQVLATHPKQKGCAVR